jgi:hypothetical protein
MRHEAIQPDEEGRFRAFEGYDPEGYYLEFDTFLPHPLNDRLLRALARWPTVACPVTEGADGSGAACGIRW